MSIQIGDGSGYRLGIWIQIMDGSGYRLGMWIQIRDDSGHRLGNGYILGTWYLAPTQHAIVGNLWLFTY